jgi:hypothetical protein
MSEVKSEIKFLQGPQSRWKEFKFTVKILVEFVRGFRALHFVRPCVTFFGSARFEEDHEYYQLTQKAAGEIAKLGFTTMTGGGQGLMEAAHHELLEQMKQKQTISSGDLILVTDSIDEAVQFIRDHSIAKYGLVSDGKPSPIKWLLADT